MDLSDGLSLDLHRLCVESGVAAELSGKLPIARGASLEQALHGGEDYELLFTAPPAVKVSPVIDRIPVTRIGTITKGPAGRVLFNERPLELRAFDHFYAAKPKSAHP
jgi:thiamine-monophosphate kinase